MPILWDPGRVKDRGGIRRGFGGSFGITTAMMDRFPTKDAALCFAPGDTIRKGLDPGKTADVFEMVSMSPVEIAMIHNQGVEVPDGAEIRKEVFQPERISRQKLPLEDSWTSSHPTPFTLGLKRSAMADAAAMALTWLKVFRDEFQALILCKCEANHAWKAEDGMTIGVTVYGQGTVGESGGLLWCRLKNGAGLAALKAILANGTEIVLEEKEKDP